jgi:hypothetical protein
MTVPPAIKVDIIAEPKPKECDKLTGTATRSAFVSFISATMSCASSDTSPWRERRATGGEGGRVRGRASERASERASGRSSGRKSAEGQWVQLRKAFTTPLTCVRTRSVALAPP